jgi:2,3-bisphosphoglycerate-dependent phosphoglycerate mutase
VATIEVILVRHAKSVADGSDDFTRPLSPEGLVQAQDLTAVLAPPAAVWSSPYLRAIQTVEPTARSRGLPVRTSHELREWDDGLPFVDDWLTHYERSWADPAFTRPGGESLHDLSVRAVAAIRAVAMSGAGSPMLVASHGMFVTWALRGFGAPVGRPFWHAMPMPAIFRLRFPDPRAMPALSGPGL